MRNDGNEENEIDATIRINDDHVYHCAKPSVVVSSALVCAS